MSRSESLHRVSEHLPDRHPYLQEPFPRSVFPLEIAAAHGHRAFPKLDAVLRRPELDNVGACDALETAWKRQLNGTVSHQDVERLCRELKALDRSERLLEAYKEEAIRSIAQLDNPSLKGLLRRMIGKIFNDAEIKGWCSEVHGGGGDQLFAETP